MKKPTLASLHPLLEFVPILVVAGRSHQAACVVAGWLFWRVIQQRDLAGRAKDLVARAEAAREGAERQRDQQRDETAHAKDLAARAKIARERSEQRHGERDRLLDFVLAQMPDAPRRIALVQAAWRRDDVVVSRLLKAASGADEDAVEAVEAAREALEVAVAQLGTNAARVEEAERERDEARRQGNEILSFLLSMLTVGQKEDALVRAAHQEKDGAVAELLANGVNPDARGSDALAGEGLLGCTALGEAARSCHPLCVEKLLEGGADVNAQHEEGWTALHCTALGDSNDADPQSRDCRAARVAAMLLEAGADKTLVDNQGRTALMVAALRSHLACVKVLLAGDAVLNGQDEAGLTALHYAALQDSSDADPQSRDRRAAPVVAILLEAGADKAPVNINGALALEIAEQRGHAQAAELLRE